jgi:hypothetical protein
MIPDRHNEGIPTFHQRSKPVGTFPLPSLMRVSSLQERITFTHINMTICIGCWTVQPPHDVSINCLSEFVTNGALYDKGDSCHVDPVKRRGRENLFFPSIHYIL